VGKLFDLSTSIRYDSGMILATITKSLISLRGAITGVSSYSLNVQPGVDIPMCLGFVTILDEEREGGGGNVASVSKMRRFSTYLPV
jgi:hypothetical protein